MERIENEIVHKEIDLIQSCISRMANNSFLLKGWYISLAAIVVTVLMGKDFNLKTMCMFLMVISIAFWLLDSYFLRLETFYRWKYEWIIEQRLNGNREFLYDLNPARKKTWLNADEKKDCFGHFIFRVPLMVLYGIPLTISALVLFAKCI